MLKEKIKNMINEEIRVIPSKFDKIEVNKIFEETKFLIDVSFSERVYNFANNINKIVLCKQCNKKKPTFLRISIGYRDFCCYSCKNKWIYENTNVKERIADSSRKSYLKFSNDEIREQQNKRIKTMIDKGIISDPVEYPLIKIYYKSVWKFTNSNNLEVLENFEKRGRIEIPGTFQLDHKFSISEGFRQNIPTFIIGNINNLEMITSIENSSKKQKCSCTIEELMTEISKN